MQGSPSNPIIQWTRRQWERERERERESGVLVWREYAKKAGWWCCFLKSQEKREKEEAPCNRGKDKKKDR
jgi:hypothetical protein